MASNIGVQYAGGIPVPGCLQFRRNLVIKAHKTTIMGMAAINKAAVIQREASALASIPRHLHGNSSVSTKRNKTVVAAYQSVEVTLIPGIPVRTEGKLNNQTNENLKLDDKIFWGGSRPDNLQKEIKANEESSFTQVADSGGSIGALEYVFDKDKLKWIIAWSNAKNDLNKVYTEILPDDADWTEIRKNLDKSGQEWIFNGTDHGLEYSSKIVIDKTSPKPIMTATLQKLNSFSEDGNTSGGGKEVDNPGGGNSDNN